MIAVSRNVPGGPMLWQGDTRFCTANLEQGGGRGCDVSPARRRARPQNVGGTIALRQLVLLPPVKSPPCVVATPPAYLRDRAMPRSIRTIDEIERPAGKHRQAGRVRRAPAARRQQRMRMRGRPARGALTRCHAHPSTNLSIVLL